MDIIGLIKSKYHWRYLGSCVAETFITNNGVQTGLTYSQHYLLMVRGDGKRKVKKTGDNYANSSLYGRKVEASVKAWLCGGPLPEFVTLDYRPAGKLITIQGGKK